MHGQWRVHFFSGWCERFSPTGSGSRAVLDRKWSHIPNEDRQKRLSYFRAGNFDQDRTLEIFPPVCFKDCL